MKRNGRVIALGFFDGVHIGHAALLNRVVEVAKSIEAIPSVVTFDVHPDNLVNNRDTLLITDSYEKKRIINDLFSIDDVIFLRFTNDLKNMDYRTFLDLITSEFHVCHIVVGYDFTFGHDGKGNTANLSQYCSDHSIGCDIIPPVYKDEIIVSSTYIRSLLTDGYISDVNKYLGHCYRLHGTVIQGLHNGRKLGFPTLNIKMPKGMSIPRFGVYATNVLLKDGMRYYAATDVGIKPTVTDESEVLIESHLFDFDQNLYGEDITVEFYEFIRDEIRFSSMDELSSQIICDITTVQEVFTKK